MRKMFDKQNTRHDLTHKLKENFLNKTNKTFEKT